jgi:hypothetical protein
MDSYQDESKIWHTDRAIPNSAGNLCLHIIGNLNTYIGAQIEKTNYSESVTGILGQIHSKGCIDCSN